MPVEINELVIRANITAPESAQHSNVPLNDNAAKVQRLLDEMMKKLDEKDER